MSLCKVPWGGGEKLGVIKERGAESDNPGRAPNPGGVARVALSRDMACPLPEPGGKKGVVAKEVAVFTTGVDELAISRSSVCF